MDSSKKKMPAQGWSASGGKVYLGTDHAGYELKEKIKQWLDEWGYDQEDLGAFSYDAADDYPDFISLAAKQVSKNPDTVKGIILGGSGQGEAMVANRFPNVRAAVYYGGDLEIVSLSREHNDANILSLGARFISEEEAKAAVEIWLKTRFSGEKRHMQRIKKIEKYPT